MLFSFTIKHTPRCISSSNRLQYHYSVIVEQKCVHWYILPLFSKTLLYMPAQTAFCYRAYVLVGSFPLDICRKYSGQNNTPHTSVLSLSTPPWWRINSSNTKVRLFQIKYPVCRKDPSYPMIIHELYRQRRQIKWKEMTSNGVTCWRRLVSKRNFKELSRLGWRCIHYLYIFS